MPSEFLLVLLLFRVYASGVSSQRVSDDGTAPHMLVEDEVYSCCKPEANRQLPVVYCYDGSPKVITRIWRTVSAVIDLPPEQFDIFEGNNNREILDQFEARLASWLLNILNWRRKHFYLDPFNTTCLGIRTDQDYTIKLEVVTLDLQRLVVFSLSVLLFFFSPFLAANSLFYYLMGICIGVLASVLIIFYFTLKLLPLKRSVMLGMIAGGSTIAFYVLRTFYDQCLHILYLNLEYILCYLMLSVLISFIVCYRFGPVTDPRSRNLIKWTLQAIALTGVFSSSHLQEFTVAANVLILLIYNFPVVQSITILWKLTFQKPQTQLTLRKDQKRGVGHLGHDHHQRLRWEEIRKIMFAKAIEEECHQAQEHRQCYEEVEETSLLTDDSSDE